MIDLKVLSASATTLSPEVSGFSYFSGKEALTQRIVKLLLTAKGSDFFNASAGSTLLSLYGVYTEAGLASVKTLLPIIIKSFVDNLKQEQSIDILNGIAYADEDLLEDIQIVSIDFDKTYSGWIIELEIINKAHDTVKIVVP